MTLKQFQIIPGPITWIILAMHLLACSKNETHHTGIGDTINRSDSANNFKHTNQGGIILQSNQLHSDLTSSDSLYCQTNLNQAQSHARLGNIDSAIIHWQRVLEVCQLPDVNSSNFLAQQLVETGALEAALPVCVTAIKLAREARDSSALVDAYQTVSSLFHRKKEFDSMRLYAQHAYELSTEIQATAARSRALMTLAAYYTYREAYPQAIRDMNQALLLSQETDDSLTQLHSLFNLGVLFDHLEKSDSAMSCYKRALAIAQNLQIPGKVASLQFTLSYNLYDRGEYREAFDVINEAIYQEDSLRKEEFGQALSELQVKYQTAIKEQNITLLKAKQRKTIYQRNTAWLVAVLTLLILSSLAIFVYQKLTHSRRMARERFRRIKQEQEVITLQKMVTAQETERRRIAQDLHDGLGALLSTARIKMGKVSKGIDRESNDLLDSTQEIVVLAGKEVRRISHDMMPGVLMELGLAEGIWAFLEGIQTIESPEIIFNAEVLNMIKLHEETEVTIYRIIQELVSNSLKHARASQIEITFVHCPDETILSLTYSDNGVGFDPAFWEQKDHMGLSGLKSRISILKGSLILDEESTEGTCIKITLPAA